ncbi:hypothetical protein RV09_GL001254 [Enterococcus moraviensis]|nr:hypothetical protein RV09_GL001254 [Enterococcus moraviensis]
MFHTFPTGIEPAAYRLGGDCSILLSYENIYFLILEVFSASVNENKKKATLI